MGAFGEAPKEGNRVVFANNPGQPLWAKVNIVTNTKYTWWNFVFKNLLEQFRCVDGGWRTRRVGRWCQAGQRVRERKLG